MGFHTPHSDRRTGKKTVYQSVLSTKEIFTSYHGSMHNPGRIGFAIACVFLSLIMLFVLPFLPLASARLLPPATSKCIAMVSESS